jgi:RNA polymerase sigma-70 factor (ECF subfamily)
MIAPELIKRCQEGDEEAFAALYRAVYKKTVWTAYLACGSMDRSEDIVQEAFYECFRDIPKLRDPNLFQAWFNRILIRKCQKQLRKKFTVESLDDENAPEPSDDVSVADIAETNQTSRIVREAVLRLRAPLKTTVILYYFQGLNISEIAKTMSCFQGTVKSRLHYAKQKLGRELANEFMYDDDRKFNGRSKEGTVL